MSVNGGCFPHFCCASARFLRVRIRPANAMVVIDAAETAATEQWGKLWLWFGKGNREMSVSDAPMFPRVSLRRL